MSTRDVNEATYLGSAPINVSADNGSKVNVTINVIRRDLHADSLRWFADMLEGRAAPSITCSTDRER